MIGYNIDEFAVEEALKSWLEENLEIKLPIILGTDFNEVQYPCIFVTLESADTPVEEMEGTGTYDVTVNVGLITNIGITREKHKEMLVQMTDLIFNEGLEAGLNAGRVEGLFVQRVRRPRRSTRIQNELRVTTQTLVLMCSMSA